MCTQMAVCTGHKIHQNLGVLPALIVLLIYRRATGASLLRTKISICNLAMVSSDNSPIQDHMTPPGTVRLIGGLLSNSGTIQDVVPLTKLWTDPGTKVNEVMLHPTPSSDPNDPLVCPALSTFCSLPRGAPC